MHWFAHWWTHEIVHGHKGPLLLALIAFVVTFLTTRTITRLIRAGKGPFHNLSSGGVHLHHSTPGTLLLVAGAFTAIGADGRTPLNYVSAAMVGVGASLVLDEFAMIFHLQDVYWAQEGQLSVNVVTLSAACVGLAVAGVSPVGVPGLSGTDRFVRGGVAAALVIHLVLVAITALKGKYPTALVGMFLAPLSWYAAVRLARPHSPWARKFYSAKRIQHATRRADAFDERWYPMRKRWDDLIGGAPSEPDPTVSPTPGK
ncbi:hypothetical protein HJ588_04505 [Flexivirga sp. ID2601S]|uniref:Integral membrane protein n=1 Tax=Flexivirga aerilata TaxID=1656889 RepID=A0A849AF65_9MICO|nr:hypothetical protein [Flexivirga aerilata]NNG38537.1 hypothetical protein [Flexivirga aerilata]